MTQSNICPVPASSQDLKAAFWTSQSYQCKTWRRLASRWITRAAGLTSVPGAWDAARCGSCRIAADPELPWAKFGGQLTMPCSATRGSTLPAQVVTSDAHASFPAHMQGGAVPWHLPPPSSPHPPSLLYMLQHVCTFLPSFSGGPSQIQAKPCQGRPPKRQGGWPSNWDPGVAGPLRPPTSLAPNPCSPNPRCRRPRAE